MTTRNYSLAAGMLSCLLLFFLFSCKKENLPNGPVTQTPATGTIPRVNAGADLTVLLPSNVVTLSGSSANATNISKIEWRKIGGPNFWGIEDKSKLTTRATGLIEGTYAFELTITTGAGLSGSDTVNVFVVDPNPPGIVVGANEVIFTNLKWIYPWYSVVEAQNIYTYVPRNKPLKVFVKRDGTANWIEVPPSFTPTSDYEYYISAGTSGSGTAASESLSVMYYLDDAYDTPDVKVTF